MCLELISTEVSPIKPESSPFKAWTTQNVMGQEQWEQFSGREPGLRVTIQSNIYILSTFPKTWVWIKSEHLAVKTNPALMKALDPTWSILVYQKTIVSWTPLGGIVTIGNNYLVLILSATILILIVSKTPNTTQTINHTKLTWGANTYTHTHSRT